LRPDFINLVTIVSDHEATGLHAERVKNFVVGNDRDEIDEIGSQRSTGYLGPYTKGDLNIRWTFETRFHQSRHDRFRPRSSLLSPHGKNGYGSQACQETATGLHAERVKNFVVGNDRDEILRPDFINLVTIVSDHEVLYSLRMQSSRSLLTCLVIT
jgi:hypothetical protein